MRQAMRVISEGASGAVAWPVSFDARMAVFYFVLIAVLPLLPPRLGGGYLLIIGERAVIFAIAALSLELLIGAGGLVSFGHAAFLGIGAYAGGIAASHGLGILSIALPAALAAAAAFALATGAIAVRTRGVYFIMITLAFAQMAFFIATSLAPYGGDDGLTWPTRTTVFGARILKNETVFYYVGLALLILTYVCLGHLLGSRFGRVLRGLKDNDTRMQAIGFTPYLYRLAAYVIAGTLCGAAGFLLGNQAEFVSPAYMHWQRSGELIIMVLLGGSGTLYGPMFGALVFLLLEETLSHLTEHWKVVLGPALVLMALFASGGIAGAIAGWRQRRGALARLASARARSARRHLAGGLARLPSWHRLRQPLRTYAAASRIHWLAARTPACWRAGKRALRRGLQRSPALSPRGLKTSIARWWQP
jgi:branched-chain amino acid transport system permease protein